jgi:chromosome segregation ATPase
MDLVQAVEQRDKATRKLEGLQAAIADAAAEIEKVQAIVEKAQENVNKTLEDGAAGKHRLEDLKKAKAKLTDAISWHQELEGQLKTARQDIDFAKQILPDIVRRVVREKAAKLIPEMERAIDSIHEIIRKADEIYLECSRQYGVTLPAGDRESLLPMVRQVKAEWTAWIGPFTRGLQNELARRNAGEYS